MIQNDHTFLNLNDSLGIKQNIAVPKEMPSVFSDEYNNIFKGESDTTNSKPKANTDANSIDSQEVQDINKKQQSETAFSSWEKSNQSVLQQKIETEKSLYEERRKIAQEALVKFHQERQKAIEGRKILNRERQVQTPDPTDLYTLTEGNAKKFWSRVLALTKSDEDTATDELLANFINFSSKKESNDVLNPRRIIVDQSKTHQQAPEISKEPLRMIELIESLANESN